MNDETRAREDLVIDYRNALDALNRNRSATVDSPEWRLAENAENALLAALAAQPGARGQATEGEAVDAARYYKLRRWMSSNVPEGWTQVEQLAAIACYMSWDDFDSALDALPQCEHGLCAGCSAPTPQAAAPGALPAVMTQNPLRPDEPADEQHSRARYVSGWNACHAAFTAVLAASVAPEASQTRTFCGGRQPAVTLHDVLLQWDEQPSPAVQSDRAALVAEVKRIASDAVRHAALGYRPGEKFVSEVHLQIAIDRLGASTAAEGKADSPHERMGR